MRKRRVLESGEAHEYSDDVAEFAPALEAAIDEFAHVGRKSQADEVQIKQIAPGMAQTNYVARPPASFPERLDGMFDAPRGEILQKRISRAQRQESESRPSAG